MAGLSAREAGVKTSPPYDSPVPYAPLKPKRLQPGDKVGLVAPASAIFLDVDADIARESLEALGLKVIIGQHILDFHIPLFRRGTG